jgi:hypothetical protein
MNEGKAQRQQATVVSKCVGGLPRHRSSLREELARTMPSYRSYLQSNSWRIKRRRILDLAGNRCEKCGANEKLQVHHLTYKRLGAELDTDLVALCPGCHYKAHFTKGGKKRRGLKIEGLTSRTDPRATRRRKKGKSVYKPNRAPKKPTTKNVEYTSFAEVPRRTLVEQMASAPKVRLSR